MRRCYFILLLATLFILQNITPILHAQDRLPVPIPNSQRFTLFSKNTNLEYGIYIYLPSSYSRDTTRTYPSLYMLDGDTNFYFGGEIQRSLLWSNQIQEFILVGIAYEKQNMRSRDFSLPTSLGGAPGSGGAENFYNFIAEELIPVIDRDYRTTVDGRGLFGHSMGGMFTLWTMFTHTETFDRYIVSSPVLNSLYPFEAAYAAAHKDLPVSCFISVGEREGVDLYTRMLNILKSRNYPSFRLRDHIIADGVHGSVAPQCYSEGVRFVYDRAITLPPEKLVRYAGRYQGENIAVEIQFAGDRLIAITDRIRGTAELFPASETVFFTKGWPNDVTFTLDTEGVPRELTLSRTKAARVE